jgi:hypothetical protein
LSHALVRGLLFLCALALGSACKRAYVPVVDKDRLAKLSIKTADIGMLPGPTLGYRVELAVHDLRSGCGALGYQGSIRLTEGATPITTLPANEPMALIGSWHERGFFVSYDCAIGLVFFPEHGRRYVFGFTGPAKTPPSLRDLTCAAKVFEHINDPDDPQNLAPVPAVTITSYSSTEEVCAASKEVMRARADSR